MLAAMPHEIHGGRHPRLKLRRNKQLQGRRKIRQMLAGGGEGGWWAKSNRGQIDCKRGRFGAAVNYSTTVTVLL